MQMLENFRRWKERRRFIGTKLTTGRIVEIQQNGKIAVSEKKIINNQEVIFNSVWFSVKDLQTFQLAVIDASDAQETVSSTTVTIYDRHCVGRMIHVGRVYNGDVLKNVDGVIIVRLGIIGIFGMALSSLK